MATDHPSGAHLEVDSWTGWGAQSGALGLEQFEPGTPLASGRFIIERFVGRGATGVVYAARDQVRGRLVAIKTLGLNSPEANYELKREFRGLTDLSHPNLIRLHELFVEPRRVYFSMDLVRGGLAFDAYVRGLHASALASTLETMQQEPTQSGTHRTQTTAEVRPLNPDSPVARADGAQRRAAGAPDLPKLKAALKQLVRALHTLHRAGKVHRDIKPANVLVEASGRLVVLDFGLMLDDRTRRDTLSSDVHELVGTPRYMAPELFRWGTASPASDWYSVGVMLYEALTGTGPYLDGRLPLVPTLPDPPSLRAPELGTEFDEICCRLLDPNPAERANGADLLEALGLDNAPLTPKRGVQLIDLVGRGEQLQALSNAFERLAHGHRPAAVLLGGRSGMGKTALLRDFILRHEPDAMVLSGTCHEQEAVAHKAFDEIIDGLSRYLLGLQPEEVLRLVPIAEAQHLLRLFPALARVPTLAQITLREEDADPRALRKHAYDALGNLLAQLGREHNLVLVIDDLQWGDVDSARLLYELFARSERPRALLVLSYRDDEIDASPCLERLLTGSRCLADVIDVEQLQVQSLTPTQSSMLALRLLASIDMRSTRRERAEKAERLCAEAQGSPLLLHELARHRSSAGGWETEVGLADVVRFRLAQTDDVARRLFRLLCVAGTPVRAGILAAALDLKEIDVALIQLETERLIRARTSRHPDAVEVVHDGIRSAALRDVDEQEQGNLHRRLAAAYEHATEADVEALARHYAGAGLRAEASHWAEKAALRASDAFAFDRAAALFRMALELGGDDLQTVDRLRVRLAAALADAGRAGEAAQLFMDAAKRSSQRQALEYRQRAADQWLVSGHVEKGLEVLSLVFSEMGMRLPQGKLAAVLELLQARLKVKLRRAHPKETELAPNSLELLRLDTCRAAWVMSFVSPLHGAALQAMFLSDALRVGDRGRLAMGLGMEAVQRSVEGDAYERVVLPLQRRAGALATELGTPHALAFQQLVVGNSCYLSGRWRTCAEAAEQADQIFTRRCRGSTWELNTLRYFWGNALAYMGRYREVRRRLRGWLSEGQERDDRYAQAGLILTGCRAVRLPADEPEAALLDTERALALWDTPGFGVFPFMAAIARVQALVYQGEHAKAVELARAARLQTDRSTLKRVQICRINLSHHCSFSLVALAATTKGTERDALLKEARHHERLLRKEHVTWGTALADYVAAQIALQTGKEDTARAALSAAIDGFDECSMAFFSAGARLRLAEVVEPTRRRTLQNEALLCFETQGVNNPARFAAFITPGR